MTTPTDPPSWARTAVLVATATPTDDEVRKASDARLWVGIRRHTDKVREQQKAAARLKNAARNRKYREARKASALAVQE